MDDTTTITITNTTTTTHRACGRCGDNQRFEDLGDSMCATCGKTRIIPACFPLDESLDHGRTFTERWFGGFGPLADLFADPTVTLVELTDKWGDVRTYRRVTR